MPENDSINTIDDAFDDVVLSDAITIEEGVILGRNLHHNILTGDAVSAVNDASGDGQFVWDGTYRVKLDRGLTIKTVPAQGRFGRGAQKQSVYPIGEKICVVWLNRHNTMVPMILDGVSMEYMQKALTGNISLLDPGEEIIRSAISADPTNTEAGSEYPFFDNQHDNPATALKSDGSGFSENVDKVIKLPGAELFLDKFGRSIQLARPVDSSGKPFLITMGSVDTGQDDVSKLNTASEQDSYYDKIQNDESEPVNVEEPFAPKSINVVQYQTVKKSAQLENDTDPNNKVNVGLLPRFDRWKFQPIVIRKYGENTDGVEESGTIYSVYQQRAQTIAGANIYGYVRTITDQGDVKEFIPRHVNQRIVGDQLISIGGNYDFKIKTKGTDTTNKFHMECKSDGAYRIRVNETNSGSKFDMTVATSGDWTVVNQGAIAFEAKNLFSIASLNSNVTTSGNETHIQGSTYKIAREAPLDAMWTALYNALLSWVPIPVDGGAALKVALSSIFFPAYNTNHLNIGSEDAKVS